MLLYTHVFGGASESSDVSHVRSTYAAAADATWATALLLLVFRDDFLAATAVAFGADLRLDFTGVFFFLGGILVFHRHARNGALPATLNPL